jgi:hypothetical protein
MRCALFLALAALAACSDRKQDASDDGESGGPTACDPSTADIGPEVSVTIRNETAAPLYFTQTEFCSALPPFLIRRGAERVDWYVEPCVSCDAVIDGQCGCPALCAADSVIRIDPGGSYEEAWTGAEAFSATLPAECTTEGCGDQCTALAQAVDGAYTARANAGTEVTCGMGIPCDCIDTPDDAGWCSAPGIRAGDQLQVDVDFDYPDTDSVEIVFD